MLLILPLPWLAAIFSAAFIHESCHLICLKLFRIPVYCVHVTAHGAAIRTASLSPLPELICAAAGPAGSFLCLVFSRSFPLLALCGFLQGIYNLLPVYPLDGGRILYAAANLLFPAHAEQVCMLVSRSSFVIILFACIGLYFKAGSVIFLFLAVYFLLTAALCRNIPCKEGRY